ncbi:MAG: L-type lectin-domain containing protein, partial [Flavobacteriales bacterium]
MCRKRSTVYMGLMLLLLTMAEAQTYFLNGDAQAIGSDCYQLTSFLNNQGGTVWYADQIDLTQNLDIQFLMNFGTFDSNGADGICFVLQTVGTSSQGTNGGGLGYEGFGTSLGIEFDTYQNGNYGDPIEDHIAIEQNGDINHSSAANIAGPIQADALDANIEDGEDHIVRIVWDAQTHIIQVYFDCVFRLSAEIDLITQIFGGQNLVYWGFTASTG